MSCVGTGGQRMSATLAAAGEISLTGANLTYIVIAIVIAFVALGFAAALVRVVLAAGRGTPQMQEIAGAVQEGRKAFPAPPVQDPGDLRRRRRCPAVPAAGQRRRRQRDAR